MTRFLPFGLALILVALFVGGPRADAKTASRESAHAGDRSPSDTKAATREGSDVSAKRAPRRLPGAQPGGGILLPTQWSLQPAGTQLVLGDFPVNVVMHPSEPFAAVLHSGYGVHEIVVVDLRSSRVVSRAVLPETFYGLCFDPEGKRLFASGAADGLVHAFRFEQGYLSGHREIRVGSPGKDAVTAGLSCSRDGKTLFVASAWGDTVSLLPPAGEGSPRHVALPPDSYPYTSLPDPGGRRLFVSLWGRAAVAVVNLDTLKIEAEWPTDSHPTEMALSPEGARLFVACADSNVVTVLDAGTGRALEAIGSALHPRAPRGSTPNSLALSPDGKTLLVANADNNNVAVVDVSRPGQSAPKGFIPAGWYPTSVRFVPKGDRICIANGKGLISRANRNGPNPAANPPLPVREYIAGLFRGTLAILDVPSDKELAAFTKQAYECSPLLPDAGTVAKPVETGNPIPSAPGGTSPIQHVIYIIKENRTYDQVMGDVLEGNGDPALCIFPEAVTPNHHALAREFVLLDNFYVESEVSADGHEWSTAAYATDFVEKIWPLSYRQGAKERIPYPSQGSFPIAFPSSGYIWDRCREAGLGYRSYGEFIEPGPGSADPATTKVKALQGHFDPLYRPFDLDYPDVKRAARFIEELRGFEARAEMPRFIVMHLPNDHTYGARAGKPTPTAFVADNDLALGQIVEAVSHSRFWKDTAIFVVEDDAQNGSDHVDTHRTVALVVSPYARRGAVDSSLYSTASMLRTIELILGLAPMTQFDAAALPMYASFRQRADLTPYQHRPAGADLHARNTKSEWGSGISETIDFSRADAADDLLLNEMVWRSVRGPDSPMPPPIRASFVRPIRGLSDSGERDDD